MKKRLAQEAWVSNRGIWIAAKNGVITLFGMIDTEEEKPALGVMARTIAHERKGSRTTCPMTLLPGHGHWSSPISDVREPTSPSRSFAVCAANEAGLPLSLRILDVPAPSLNGFLI